MTSPLLDDIQMPYSVTFQVLEVGGNNPVVLPGQEQYVSPGWDKVHKLEPGTYDLRFTYDGPEKLQLMSRPPGGGFQTFYTMEQGEEGVQRHSDIITLDTRSETLDIRIWMVAEQGSVDAGRNVIMKVYPMSRFRTEEAKLNDLGIYSGTGFPEGKVTAPIGSTYTDLAATNGAIKWVKTDGAGNTGWKVEYGDTGWRNVNQYFSDMISGYVYMRRIGSEVFWDFLNFKAADQDPSWNQWTVPLDKGFAPVTHSYFAASGRSSNHSKGPVWVGNNNIVYIYDQKPQKVVESTFSYVTNDQWPSFLPGVPR